MRTTTMLAIFAQLACAAAHFPGATWESRDPASVGLDGAWLGRLADALGGRGCVVKDGYIVKAWGSQSQIGDWLSSAKPVLSTLLLFAIQEGKVSSPDTPIQDFGWKLSPKDQTLTFRHLANMTSGYGRRIYASTPAYCPTSAHRDILRQPTAYWLSRRANPRPVGP